MSKGEGVGPATGQGGTTGSASNEDVAGEVKDATSEMLGEAIVGVAISQMMNDKTIRDRMLNEMKKSGNR